MNISLNGEVIATSCNLLEDFLKEQCFIDKQGIAVALNEIVIRKEDWCRKSLNENDRILIITATQGG